VTTGVTDTPARIDRNAGKAADTPARIDRHVIANRRDQGEAAAQRHDVNDFAVHCSLLQVSTVSTVRTIR
jgi:hypothetical protein